MKKTYNEPTLGGIVLPQYGPAEAFIELEDS